VGPRVGWGRLLPARDSWPRVRRGSACKGGASRCFPRSAWKGSWGALAGGGAGPYAARPPRGTAPSLRRCPGGVALDVRTGNADPNLCRPSYGFKGARSAPDPAGRRSWVSAAREDDANSDAAQITPVNRWVFPGKRRAPRRHLPHLGPPGHGGDGARAARARHPARLGSAPIGRMVQAGDTRGRRSRLFRHVRDEHLINWVDPLRIVYPEWSTRQGPSLRDGYATPDAAFTHLGPGAYQEMELCTSRVTARPGCTEPP
jgi:hypothetical protein